MTLTTQKPITKTPTTALPRTNIPVTELPKTILPTVEILKTSNPRTAVPKTAVPRVSNNPVSSFKYTRTNQQVSPFSDYNDPTQINSFADVIWNTISQNNKLKTRDFGLLSSIGDVDIPLISNAARALTSSMDLILSTTIEPIKQKNFKALGINALINFSESMDILASPVKGLIYDGPEGLIKGSVGRTNYDIDTGYWFLDMLGEFVVDPFNWISLGAAGVAKGLAGTAGKEVLEGAVDTSVKQGVKILASNLEPTDGLKKLFKNYVSSNFMVNGGDINKAVMGAMNQLGGDKVFSREFIEVVQKEQLNNLAEAQIRNLAIAKGLSGIVQTSETIEQVLAQGSLAMNLIPVKTLKNLITKNPIWVNISEHVSKIIYDSYIKVTGLEDVFNLINYSIAKEATPIIQDHITHVLNKAGLETIDAIDLDKMVTARALDNINKLNKILDSEKLMPEKMFIPEVLSEVSGNRVLANSVEEAISKNPDMPFEDILKSIGTDKATILQNINDIFTHNLSIIDELNKSNNGIFQNLKTEYVAMTYKLSETLQKYTDLELFKDTINKTISDMVQNKNVLSSEELQKQLDITKNLIKEKKYLEASLQNPPSTVKFPETDLATYRRLNNDCKIYTDTTSFDEKLVSENPYYFKHIDTKKKITNVIDAVDSLLNDKVQFNKVVDLINNPLLKNDTVLKYSMERSEPALKTLVEFKIKMDKIKIEADSKNITPDYSTLLTKNNINRVTNAVLDLQRELNTLVAIKPKLISKEINNFIATLQSIDMYGAAETMLSADSFTVLYLTKTEELYKLVNCFEPQTTTGGFTVDLSSSLNYFNNNDTAKAFLNSFEKLDNSDISAVAKNCKAVINNLNNINDFVKNIYSDPYISTELKNFYLSSLMKNKNIHGATAILNPEFIHKTVMKNFTTFVNSAQSVRQLNLNYLLSESKTMLDSGNKAVVDNFNVLSNTDKEMFNKLVTSGETHTALDDAYLTELIIRLRNPQEYIDTIVDGIPLNKAGKGIYVSDLEATGLSANNSYITELALKQMGTDNTLSFRLAYSESTHDISEEILKSRYPGLDTEKALQQYKEFYNPNNPANAGVKFFDNESDMLQAYKDYLNSLGVGSDVIFHNGKAYDTPMLFDRGIKYGLDFTSSPIYTAKDSLYDMRKLNFGYNVSQIEEIKLWNYTKQYINKLTIEDISLSFLNPLSSHNLDTIHDMLDIVLNSKRCAFTESLVSSLAKLDNDLNTLKKTLITDVKNTVFTKEFLDTPQAKQVFLAQCQKKYLQNQTTLNNINTYYPDPIKAASEKASLERQQAGIKKTLQLAQIDKQGNITGTVNMNLVRMFYSYTMDSIPAQGYDKFIDLNLIRSYINIPADMLINITNQYGRIGFSWESFYDLVRDFPAAYKSMNNAAAVIENKELIRNNLIKLKEIMGQESGIYKFIKEDNIDARANYLMAEKLYTRAVERKFDISTLDEDFIKLVKESNELKNKYSADEAIKKQIALVEKGIDDSDLQVQAWIDLLDEDLNNVQAYSDNILRKLSTDKTYSGFTNTRTQFLLTLAAPVQNSFKLLQEHMSKLSPTDKLKVVNIIKRSNEINQYKAVRQLIEQSPEDLLATLYTNSMVIVYDKSFIDSIDTGETTKYLLSRTGELKEKGIKLITDDASGLIFIVPSKDNVFKTTIDLSTNESIYELNGKTITVPQLKEIVQSESMRGQLSEEIIDALNKGQESMVRITDGYAAGSLYEVTNTDWYKTLYERLPKAVQNELGDISKFINPALFNGRSRYNLSVFGSYDVRSRFSNFTTNSFIKNYSNTFKTVGKNATAKCHYIDFILNSGTSVNNGVIGELLKAEKYDDIIKTFEDASETVLAALVYNKSGTPKLIEIKPTSKANLIRAQKLDAKILDYHVFSTAYNVINSQTLSDMNPILREYTKLLRVFKLGYLTSTGYVMRNIIDTFGKNLIQSKGNIIATAKYTYSAMKMYSEYDKIILDIINTSPNKVLSKSNIKTYFDTMKPKMSYEEWSYIHDILNEGAFMGEVKSLELYHGFRRTVKNQDIADEDLQGLFETYQHAKKTLNPVNTLMGINSNIEDIQRLASYLMMRDNGMNFSEAVARTAYNHFDYNLKTDFQKVMELVMPFYTFRMKNINYWLNVISENGWLAGALRDVMTPIWDFDDAEYYELSHNQSLQSRILSGNVQILDSGVTLRLNPSVSDALKFATDPFGEMYNSLFSPIQMLIESGLTLMPDVAIKQGVKDVFNIYDSNNKDAFDTVYDLLNFVPFGANAQRFMMGYKYAKETESPLPMVAPSVFGRVKRFENKTYNKYNNRGNYSKYSSRKANYPKRRKIAKPRNIYPRRNWTPYRNNMDYYPINFKQIYIDGMYSVPNISTYTARANRYYHFSRLNRLPTVSIYDKLYTSRGKPRWDAMLQPVTPQNLKYVIKNTIHYK